MAHVPTGPLPRTYGCSIRGSKGAAKILKHLHGGPYDGQQAWVQPLVGPLPLSARGHRGEYVADKHGRLSWASTLPM